MKEKPNILMILIDDMGWMDLSCYGSNYYETPNIDRLMQQGQRFTDAYASCPVCSPTRASVLSGKYPARVGVTDWIGAHNEGYLIDAPYTKYLPLEEKSLASALKEGGYKTWHVGKWHLGDAPYYPENHGFDVNIGGSHKGSPHDGFFSPYNLENLEDGPEGEYLTDRLTDDAIELLKSRGDEPFFLNLWHYAVHTPIQAHEKDIIYFKEKAEKMGLDKMQTFAAGDNFPFDRHKHLRIKRRLLQSDPAYAAMVYNLDFNIGRLLEHIDDNTVIIFTSDNGGLATAEGSPTCNYPLNEGKGWMFEGGVRVPLSITWPGNIEESSINSTPVTSTDFYPTILELAGLPLMPGQHVDGVSLIPELLDTGKIERDAIYWHYPHYGNQGGTPGASIRMGDYKLIEFYEDEHYELYNFKNDIEELKDISKIETLIVKEMIFKLDSWKKSVEAILPEKNMNRTCNE